MEKEIDFIDAYIAIRGICGRTEPTDEEITRYLNRCGIRGEIKDGEVIAFV